MGFAQAPRDGDGGLRGLGLAEHAVGGGAAFEGVAEGLTVEQLHRQEHQAAVILAEVHHPDGARVGQPGGDVRFSKEAAEGGLVALPRRRGADLQRHGAAGAELPRGEHVREPAHPDALEELVAAGDELPRPYAPWVRRWGVHQQRGDPMLGAGELPRLPLTERAPARLGRPWRLHRTHHRVWSPGALQRQAGP